MAYFTYSKGFKSGGFDMRGNALLSPDTKNGYNAETANNYELGLKSTLLDDTLLLNLAVFYDPYTDAQIQLGEVTINNGLPANVTFTTNAGKQINEGAELQSAWRATRALTFGANVGYLDSTTRTTLFRATSSRSRRRSLRAARRGSPRSICPRSRPR